MKKVKSLIAAMLALCLLCTAVPVSAAGIGDSVSDDSQTSFDNDMSVTAANSFGSLIAQEIEAEADGQEENNGINIFSVEVEGNIATAEFETLQSATLVVAIYDESGVEMLASGSEEVTRDDTTAEVTIDVEAMPQYFYLKAFLIDSRCFRPLCTAYESPNYTQEMQEFFAKTTDDFEAEKVLNLDGDETNNFAVYNDETVIIEPNGVDNRVVSADDESKTYVIENADDTITSLQSGDIFTYSYDDENILIVKVASISIDGTTATIVGDEVDIEEVFDYVKIEGTSDLSTADYDPSVCSEGVTYEGISTEEENSKVSSAVGASLEGNYTVSRDFTLKKEIGKVTISGGLSFSAKATAKVYVTLSYQYLELKIDYSAKISTSITGKVEAKLALGSFGFSPVAGVYIDFTPSFVVEGSVSISVSGTLSGALGLRASNTSGIENISTAPSFKPEIKIEGTLFIGISLEPNIKILGSVITASMTAKLGTEISASMSKTVEDTSSQIHDCNFCISGTISAKFSLSFEVKFVNNDKWKFTLNLLDKKIKICDFYYSADYDTFAFTTCPHYKYKVTVTVKDSSLKSVSGATVNNQYTTDENGRTEFYLSGGRYVFTAESDGLSSSTVVTVSDKAVSVTIILKDYILDSELDNVGSSKTKSGTFNGHTYMYVDSETSWNAAKLWCESRGGHLATITSHEENSFLYSLMQSINVKNAYFGFTDEETEGEWKWVTGEESDYTNWHEDEPNNEGYSESYGMFYYKFTDGTWNDGDFGYMTENGGTAFICEWDKIIDVSSINATFSVPEIIYCQNDAGWSSVYCYMWNDEGCANASWPGEEMTNIGGDTWSYVPNGEYEYVIFTQGSDGPQTDDLVALGKDGCIYSNETEEWSEWDGIIPPATPTPATPKEVYCKNEAGWASVYCYMWSDTDYSANAQWPGEEMTNIGGNVWKYVPNGDYENVIFSIGSSDTQTADLVALGKDGYIFNNSTNEWEVLSLSKSSAAVSSGSDGIETFAGLMPNEAYNFYSMKTAAAENPFGSANLLYITQAVADENGNLTVMYIPDEEYDEAVSFVVPLKQTDLSSAEVTADNLTYNGETQYVSPAVTLNGEALTEGEDYILTGDYSAKEPGSYTVKIRGIGLFSGEADCTYRIEYLSGDVNGDGTLDVIDVTYLQKYLAHFIDGIQPSVADFNGDNAVDINDVTAIQLQLARCDKADL